MGWNKTKDLVKEAFQKGNPSAMRASTSVAQRASNLGSGKQQLAVGGVAEEPGSDLESRDVKGGIRKAKGSSCLYAKVGVACSKCVWY